MKSMKKFLLSFVLILALTLSSSITSYAHVRITFSGTQTLAVNTSRRVYVTGTGSRLVTVSSDTNAVSLRYDSKSFIITGKKAGSAWITVSVGSIKKRFHVVVLSDKQIVQKVWKRIRRSYSDIQMEDVAVGGNLLTMWVYREISSLGTPSMRIKVNLSTGRAVCSTYYEDYYRKVPKSFLIW